MMKTMKYLSMAALGLVGAIVTGCSSDDNIIDEPQLPAKNVVTLSATVGLDEGAQARAITRALTADGVKTFAAGETMALVYKNTNGETVKAVSAALPDGDYGSTATFTFELTDPDNTKDITYIYPAAMAKDDGSVNYDALATQDGTLSTLSSSLDLATYTHAWDGPSLPTGTLANQLAILAMTLKDADGANDITSSITGLTLSDGTNNYAVTRSATAGPIYVAIRPTSSANIEVSATDGTNIYTKSLTEKTYAINNGYNVSWRMTNMLQIPLTLEAIDNGTITFTNKAPNAVKYTVNGGELQTIATNTTGSITVNTGDKVCFYGKNDYYCSSLEYGVYSNISCNSNCYIYGNIMSLIKGLSNSGTIEETYASTTELPTPSSDCSTFADLFSKNNSIKNHPTKTLVLPATTLADGCYYEMFDGCTGLTTAPELPATTMKNYCYDGMFNRCSGLTTAPELPATTLAEGCYQGMFYKCTGLTTAPVLPATTMKTSCYQSMFYECTGLTTAPVLPATTLAFGCYQYMFDGCTGLTTAPVLPATTMKGRCYQNMFGHCINLTTAPVLPATILDKECYRFMFIGCRKLSSVTCMATDINAWNCLKDWLDNAGIDPSVTTRTLHVKSSMASAGWELPTSATWTISADQ